MHAQRYLFAYPAVVEGEEDVTDDDGDGRSTPTPDGLARDGTYFDNALAFDPAEQRKIARSIRTRDSNGSAQYAAMDDDGVSEPYAIPEPYDPNSELTPPAPPRRPSLTRSAAAPSDRQSQALRDLYGEGQTPNAATSQRGDMLARGPSTRSTSSNQSNYSGFDGMESFHSGGEPPARNMDGAPVVAMTEFERRRAAQRGKLSLLLQGNDRDSTASVKVEPYRRVEADQILLRGLQPDEADGTFVYNAGSETGETEDTDLMQDAAGQPVPQDYEATKRNKKRFTLFSRSKSGDTGEVQNPTLGRASAAGQTSYYYGGAKEPSSSRTATQMPAAVSPAIGAMLPSLASVPTSMISPGLGNASASPDSRGVIVYDSSGPGSPRTASASPPGPGFGSSATSPDSLSSEYGFMFDGVEEEMPNQGRTSPDVVHGQERVNPLYAEPDKVDLTKQNFQGAEHLTLERPDGADRTTERPPQRTLERPPSVVETLERPVHKTAERPKAKQQPQRTLDRPPSSIDQNRTLERPAHSPLDRPALERSRRGRNSVVMEPNVAYGSRPVVADNGSDEDDTLYGVPFLVKGSEPAPPKDTTAMFDNLLQLTHASAVGSLTDADIVEQVRRELQNMRRVNRTSSSAPTSPKLEPQMTMAASPQPEYAAIDPGEDESQGSGSEDALRTKYARPADAVERSEYEALKREEYARAPNNPIEVPQLAAGGDLDGLVPTSEKGLLKLERLYIQRRDAILSGKQPCTRGIICKLAAYQMQIEFGPHLQAGVVDGRTVLPLGWAKAAGIEEELWAEKLQIAAEPLACLEYRYVRLCRTLPTYGGVSFAVHERIRGKTKKLPRLLCFKTEGMLVLDIMTLELLYVRDLSALRRWQAVGETLTMHFTAGDFEDDQLVFNTKQGPAMTDAIGRLIKLRHEAAKAGNSPGSPSLSQARMPASDPSSPSSPRSPGRMKMSPGSSSNRASPSRSPGRGAKSPSKSSKLSHTAIGHALRDHNKASMMGGPGSPQRAAQTMPRSMPSDDRIVADGMPRTAQKVNPNATWAQRPSPKKEAPQAAFDLLMGQMNKLRSDADDRNEAYAGRTPSGPTSPAEDHSEHAASSPASGTPPTLRRPRLKSNGTAADLPDDYEPEPDEIWGGMRRRFSRDLGDSSGGDHRQQTFNDPFEQLHQEIKRVRKIAHQAVAGLSDVGDIIIRPDVDWQHSTRSASAKHTARHSNTVCEAIEAIGDIVSGFDANYRISIDFGMLASWVGTMGQHIPSLTNHLRMSAALGFGSKKSGTLLNYGRGVCHKIKSLLKYLYHLLRKTPNREDAVKTAVQRYLDQARIITVGFEKLNSDDPGPASQRFERPKARDRFSGFVETEDGVYDHTPGQTREGFTTDVRDLEGSHEPEEEAIYANIGENESESDIEEDLQQEK